MSNPNFFNLTASKLSWSKTDAITSKPPQMKEMKETKEAFNTDFNPDVPPGMDMTTKNISGLHLANDRNNMLNDPTMDYSTEVSNPNGYGYVPSLNEARIQDAIDIQNQEKVIFSLGAVAGVSVIILGLLFASSNGSSSSN